MTKDHPVLTMLAAIVAGTALCSLYGWLTYWGWLQGACAAPCANAFMCSFYGELTRIVVVESWPEWRKL